MAETGRSEVLEDENQGAAGVFDEFTAPPVHSGAGWTQAEFFVDGNHSRVSLMSRIVPSPDWFVGIDSFDLCVDGGWIDTITIEVDPLDAGTDNGFTFTAPNWPTEPQGVVYRITSTHPQHPAGSFYYPFLKRLPAIATFQFIKVKEYELSEVFRHTEDSQHFDVFRAEPQHPNSIPVLGTDGVQQEIEEQRQEEEQRMEEQRQQQQQHELTTVGWASTPMSRRATAVGDKAAAAVVDSILNTYGPAYTVVVADGGGPSPPTSAAPSTAAPPTPAPRSQRRKHKTVRKIRAPRDCRVGEWGPWSECSKSCGIGEMQRRRTVVKHPRRGGRVCPPLLETKWCGSARDCAKSYFKW
ncbi:uncharacterized protein LOC113210724 [Frankliniella occidentalis]|uniref:Uncharacterized protein LOC113210724 n=1 Tax=Frankliniella occidentalis TaxID=133901 RepID=A0A6J1SUR0_FRAOC|nr:uncharacterized protein LOC113210724 [Frankliniella occidentalis]